MPHISIVLYALAGFFLLTYGYVRGATSGPLQHKILLVFVLGGACTVLAATLETASGAPVVLRMIGTPFVGFVVGVLLGGVRSRSMPPGAQTPYPRDHRQYEHEEERQ